ncbi:TetR/AcrR family transcriptional regulator [Pseudovibrio sp. Tun.PSC04-5.I4]|uniref:TetR/AcrR family transcriptional regulator n=1 Tax=Pseudovibrio sp. Tun.PSC04-5.I4 TaxID=1798213 RepID=UPI00088B247B|nr:TetR/AcrR family transcriptional regulator [Pseudovibrio sp. Tun.PSC04-5.I4]SDQ95812.1 DNA-binding transcriptional regulator, AcrR family [Pseudovibrio sp. Tun.PSC04-5.I4]
MPRGNNLHQTILDAALELFLRHGYANISIAEISEKSGAATGDIYQYFKGKPDIAVALWNQSVNGWRTQTRNTPQTHSVEDAIKASVSGLLKWGSEKPQQFRVFEEFKVKAQTEVGFVTIKEQIHAVHLQGEALYSTWRGLGAVKDISWNIASCLIVGPSYAFLNTEETVTVKDREVLVEMAWEAVKQP